MEYKKIIKGIFLERPNRFIAQVKIGEKIFTVHVKNTGRCKELLLPGCTIYLEESDNLKRKTLYDLVAVEKEITRNHKTFFNLINIDSAAPNKVAKEWILQNKKRFPEVTLLKPEFTFGNSRFDFYIEYKSKGILHKMFLEVKGCTLEFNGHAKFPDAPTERGLKHLQELTSICKNKISSNSISYECGVLFLVQMKECYKFSPNEITHLEFAQALKQAQNAGVEIFIVDCNVTPTTLTASQNLPLEW